MKSENQDKKRSVGLQTISNTKDYVGTNIAVTHNLESEEYHQILNIPHSVFLLLVTGISLFWLGSQTNGTFEENLVTSIKAMCGLVIVLGTLYFPDSVVRRPHPAFWRFISSVGLCYMVFLCFLLFQRREFARQFFKFYDSELGVPLKEKIYATNCELLSSEYPYFLLHNFTKELDAFFPIHLFGWFFKTLLIRDWKLSWFLSAFFEGLELTFRHWIPNFWECWWDQVILDILVANAGGIFAAWWVLKTWNLKNYKWTTKVDKRNKTVKFSTCGAFFSIFRPNLFVEHNWRIFSSCKRFLAAIWFIGFISLVDLGNFFLKILLWIPPSHSIIIIRSAIWITMGTVAIREYYEYSTNENYKRFGFTCWIAHMVIFLEWALVYKFSDGYFTNPFPESVKIVWSIIIAGIVLCAIFLIYKDYKKRYENAGKTKKLQNFREPSIDINEIDDS